MADLYLDMTAWRLEVDAGLLREVHDPIAEMTQRVGIAIKTHLGEWLYDTARGLPWNSEILVKAPNLDQITSRARAYLMTIDGVTGVRQLDIEVDKIARQMTWRVDVEVIEGVTGPFGVVVAL